MKPTQQVTLHLADDLAEIDRALCKVLGIKATVGKSCRGTDSPITQVGLMSRRSRSINCRDSVATNSAPSS